MVELLESIAVCKKEELEMLLRTVLSRYAELYPDWEVSVLAVRKDGTETEQLDRVIELLKAEKCRKADCGSRCEMGANNK